MITIEVGQRLRLAREEQGITLEQLSDQLKLSLRQLTALEEGDWSRLPNDTIALAFLRQYARHLGVDVADSVEQLKSDALRIHQPLTFPDPAIAPNRKWAIATAALFVLLLLGWNLFDTHDEQPEAEAPPLPEAQAQHAATPSQPTAAPKSAAPHSPEPSPTPPPRHAAAPRQQSKAPPPAAPNKPVKPVAAIAPTMTPYQAAPKQTPVVVPVSSATTSPYAAPAHHHEFSLQAGDARVWLLVEVPDGQGGKKRYREVILRPHHSIEIVREEPVIFISVGNAALLRVTYEGKTLYDFGQLGKRGRVVRHIKIAPASPPTGQTVAR